MTKKEENNELKAVRSILILSRIFIAIVILAAIYFAVNMDFSSAALMIYSALMACYGEYNLRKIIKSRNEQLEKQEESPKIAKEDLRLLAEYEVENWQWLNKFPMPDFIAKIIEKRLARKIDVLYQRVLKRRQEQKEGGTMIKRKFYLHIN